MRFHTSLGLLALCLTGLVGCGRQAVVEVDGLLDAKLAELRIQFKEALRDLKIAPTNAPPKQ